MWSILLTSFLGAVVLPGLCQQPRVTQIHEIPGYVLYHSFFCRVSFLEDIAGDTRSRGADDSEVRSRIQRQAGLTPEEAASLKRIVRDWKGRNAALQSAAKSGIKTVPEEHRRMMTELLADLKASLSPKRFAQLDTFVRATSTAKMIHVAHPENESTEGER